MPKWFCCGHIVLTLWSTIIAGTASQGQQLSSSVQTASASDVRVTYGPVARVTGAGSIFNHLVDECENWYIAALWS